MWDGLGFAQWIAPVKLEKLAFRWSKAAPKGLIGLALAQRVGAAFDQEIDLVRRQREPCRHRVEEAGARRAKLIEADPVDRERDVAATPVLADAEPGTVRRRKAAAPTFDLGGPVVGQRRERRITRPHAGADGGVGGRRDQFAPACPLHPFRKIALHTTPCFY